MPIRKAGRPLPFGRKKDLEVTFSKSDLKQVEEVSAEQISYDWLFAKGDRQFTRAKFLLGESDIVEPSH